MSEAEKNRITVDIYGQHYTIVGTEAPDTIRFVCSKVDDKMREINSANPYIDTGRLAVLTAVNAVNDYIKLQEKYEDLERQIKQLKD
ncbi:cell division protein ZapA [Rossellomorea marisflavi]|uniref:Cell division protein ZapA n=1 Tax=Rossellomorea marisflavi TaxID=189381 RepID=A0A0M0GP06_9BACI|nr:cell division protein ZapA [Rossellomorea marisflavi]KON91156.1 cell division protein ZapA [Rossellomorea marisflavi]